AKTGGVIVATMPLLRAGELRTIIEKGRIALALCEHSLMPDLVGALQDGSALQRIVKWGGELEHLMSRKPDTFDAVPTAQEDPCLLAFTSGTTGQSKATVHCHRDILAIADTFSRYLLRSTANDVFTGTPPLAFTFGLGG